MRFIFFAILLLSCKVICAQQEPLTAPLLVDSYDDKIHSSEAEQWHLEDLREKLLKQPGTKTYIIAYGGREDTPGKASRYAWRAKHWLVEFRGINANRIVPIDGGRREEFRVELWIAPSDSPPPSPTPNVNLEVDMGDNLLYDEFGIGYDNFALRAENEAVRLDGFAAALEKEPHSWGCVLAYALTGDDRMGMEWDRPGDALKVARDQKQYLVRKHGIAPSRLDAIDGGYADRLVELWIMRPGARFDRGPFIYPNRLKVKSRTVLTLTGERSHGECCKACVRSSRNSYALRDKKPARRK